MKFVDKFELTDSIFFVTKIRSELGNEIKMSHLKLQKAIYIIYAYYLIFNNTKITKIDFQAWKWGMVNYDIYQEYKSFGSNNIPIKIYNESYWKDIEKTKAFQEFYKVCVYVLNVGVWELVEICHENSPWKVAYIPMKNIKISDEKILKDYRENNYEFFTNMHKFLKEN